MGGHEFRDLADFGIVPGIAGNFRGNGRIQKVRRKGYPEEQYSSALELVGLLYDQVPVKVRVPSDRLGHVTDPAQSVPAVIGPMHA